MSEFSDLVNDQLAELNHQATMTLERLHPEPDGLPPAGSWVRAMRSDDDARVKPATPWHYVVGWDAQIGCVSTRCRRRSGGELRVAIDRYIGESPSGWQYRQRRRSMLLVESQRPADGVCRQCAIGLERDAAAEVRDRQAAELAALVDLLPAIGSIATDGTLDDAERGRRLRKLWPSPGTVRTP